MKSWVGLFGNTALRKCICPICSRKALVEPDGMSACCGGLVCEPEGVKRESIPPWSRRSPSRADQRACLEEQDHRCAYCGRRFGTLMVRKRRTMRLRLEWDHVVPFSFSQNNNARNFVAACHVCNRLKADKLFASFEEARLHVHIQAKAKGYEELSAVPDAL